MKYVVLIVGGGGDEPLEAFDGLTALEAADTPNLDRLARSGRIGTVRTTPEGFAPSPDVCLMDLLGYEPGMYHTGRAAIEAAGAGVALEHGAWALRLSLVTVGAEGTEQEGRMADHSAGEIPLEEARALVEGVMEYWREHEPSIARGLEIACMASHGAILVDRSGREYSGVEATGPDEVVGRGWEGLMPTGGHRDEGAALARLIRLSAEYLVRHEVNLARIEQGLQAANLAWIWGMGTRAELPNFASRFGVSGGLVARDGVMVGLGSLIGWERIVCADESTAMGDAVVGALGQFDLVCCCASSAMEASRRGEPHAKVTAIEAIDRGIVGPVLTALEKYGDPAIDPRCEGWRMLVVTDVVTLSEGRGYTSGVVPMAMGGAWVRSVVARMMTEREAGGADLCVDPGSDLMEYFLRLGQARRNTK